MSWTDDGNRHEGHIAMLFEDGEMHSGWAADGLFIMEYDDQGIYTGQDEIRPESAVVGWRTVCSCVPPGVSDEPMSTGYFGKLDQWQGPRWDRVAYAAEENLDERYLHMPTEVDLECRPEVEALLRGEWERHVSPDAALRAIRVALNDSITASDRMDEAVMAARGQDVSWERIGRAAGMSRQSAHERWRALTA